MNKLVIWKDSDNSPRCNDNNCTLVSGSNRLEYLADHNGQAKLEQEVRESKNFKYSMEQEYDLSHLPTLMNLADKLGVIAVRLPLYAYIHSGETIATTPFQCRFDSGQYGEVYITKEEAKAQHNVKRISKKLIEKMKLDMINEVEVLDQFLQGDVYGFNLLDEDGDIIDSCGGFYGSNWKENGLLSHLDKKHHNLIKDAYDNIDYDYLDVA